MLNSPERWRIMLFSLTALISQLCLYFLEKLWYYTLGDKNYSKKLFWGAVHAAVNADGVYCTIRPLVVSRNKGLVGSIDEAMKTLELYNFSGLDMAISRLLKPQLFNLLLTTFLHTVYSYSLIGWMWDKNVNKPEIKTCVFLSINFHNLQIVFLL